MALLKIRNWETWQTYRKDRSTPPWIKIYRRLLQDPQWNTLTDSQKGQLVSLWMLAADKNGVLPDDPRMLRKLCQLDAEPDVCVFVSLGFIEICLTTKKRKRDNQGQVACQPSTGESDAPDKSRVEESRVEGEEIAPAGASQKSKGSRLPEKFSPTEDMIAWAIAQGITDPGRETEAFADYHRSKGTVFKDWNAAWRNWMRNSKKFEVTRGNYRNRSAHEKTRDNFAAIDAWAAKHGVRAGDEGPGGNPSGLGLDAGED